MKKCMAIAVVSLVLVPWIALAGSPHFISCAIVSTTPTSVTVAAKEAGLGDEAQIVVELTALAECINPGGHHPRADNKDELAVAATVPVQNGKSSYVLMVTADFQPECSPPMSLVFSQVLVTDLTHNLTCEP